MKFLFVFIIYFHQKDTFRSTPFSIALKAINLRDAHATRLKISAKMKN